MHEKSCRHFNGVLGPGMRKDHKPCLVGQNFRDFADDDPAGRGRKLACLGEGTKTCPKFSAWTAAEVQADEEMWEKITAETLTAKAAIEQAIKAGAPSTGDIPCPACKAGQLKYSRSDYNGHIWAKCTTEDCVTFME